MSDTKLALDKIKGNKATLLHLKTYINLKKGYNFIGSNAQMNVVY